MVGVGVGGGVGGVVGVDIGVGVGFGVGGGGGGGSALLLLTRQPILLHGLLQSLSMPEVRRADFARASWVRVRQRQLGRF